MPDAENYIASFPDGLPARGKEFLQRLVKQYHGRLIGPDGVQVDFRLPELVHNHELVTQSVMLWDSPDYGETAHVWLPNYRHATGERPAYQHELSPEGEHHYYIQDFNVPTAHYRSQLPPDNQKLEAWVRHTWQNAAEWPYDLRLRWSGVPPTLKLLGSSIHRARLANFIAGRGVAARPFRGSLGKSADVLAVAAGVMGPGSIEPEARNADEQLIPYDLFTRALSASGLSPYYRRTIPERISEYLIKQTGKRSFKEVIIVEGPLTRTAKNTFTIQQITIESLQRVCGTFTSTKIQTFNPLFTQIDNLT